MRMNWRTKGRVPFMQAYIALYHIKIMFKSCFGLGFYLTLSPGDGHAMRFDISESQYDAHKLNNFISFFTLWILKGTRWRCTNCIQQRLINYQTLQGNANNMYA